MKMHQKVSLSLQYIPMVDFPCNYRLQRDGDNALGSIRPSVRPSVCLSVLSRPKGIRSHYQSKAFVCVSVLQSAVGMTHVLR